MEGLGLSYRLILLHIFLLTIPRVYGSEGVEKTSALFIFGDSTVDPGNNNYIDTAPENRANYKPYGQNGFFEAPTGRFSDGRIIVDFIAEHAKLPLIPPYLEPSADFTNGVNFASGGAGVLPETHKGLAIDLSTQLKYFEEVQRSLTEKLGEAKAKNIITEAVYFISIGSNDYIAGYLANPTMLELHGPGQYVGMVIGNLTNAIQTLYHKGARKFAFLSLSPLGCIPSLRAANLQGSDDGGCLEAASALAIGHNTALKNVLTSLEHVLRGFKFSNPDFYNWLDDRLNNTSKYGFKDGVNACCGTGPYRGLLTCGGKNKTTDFELCENANDYIWFDAFHPTERMHQQIADAVWDGPPSFVGSMSLKDLFFTREKLTIADIVDIPGGENLQ
ncbi:hypothetical protein K2173_015888 [Erythroxylum novogranatense]|uniref:Uncharacterized protein n=1 Tax=Erythroxylum novogranatense TaxID=1862640 RepID=A0AAV8SEV5_9ROSI|nr:hypothetical protein K2173_015888 [Erythroxylum novogranatense]